MYFKESYKGSSPWGGIQCSDIIARGIKMVSTAGHGGYMVTSNFASKYLSKACIEKGYIYGNYLCYEEDCLYAVLKLDLLINYAEIFTDKLVEKEIQLEDIKNSLIKSLSYYYPNYLIEIGIEPLEEEYSKFLKWEKTNQMRTELNPDLIISALNISKDESKVQVWTADSKNHIVDKSKYRELRDSGEILLLSKCI